MIVSNIFKLLFWFAAGAILYDVLTHPKGTQALGGTVNSILTTGFKYSSGR